MIPGAGGGLGHLAVQIGKGMGYRIIVSHRLETLLLGPDLYIVTDSRQGIDNGDKEEFVKGLGAEAFFDITKYSKDKEGNKKLADDVKAASSGEQNNGIRR